MFELFLRFGDHKINNWYEQIVGYQIFKTNELPNSTLNYVILLKHQGSTVVHCTDNFWD